MYKTVKPMLNFFLDIFDSETKVEVILIHLRVIIFCCQSIRNNCGVPGIKEDYSSWACNYSLELVSVGSNSVTNLKWR